MIHSSLGCLLICAAMATTDLHGDLPRVISEGRVPGVSIAIIRDGEIVGVAAAGVRNTSSGAPADRETIFEAASLSKPVFAYAVLQLVDANALSLDTKLSKYVPDYVPDDPRAAAVTVRDVLRNTTGLPNWRGAELPLKTYFAPGERFSYSGEGFIWLQRVVETVTGEPTEAVMRRLVFEPLGMHRSSYVWQAAFDANHADPHDPRLSPGAKAKPSEAKVAHSLQTTAHDYARFVQAALSGARLDPATARFWLTPQVRLQQDCVQCLSTDLAAADMHLAWGLGWGLEPDEGTFFHWGDNGRFKAFVLASSRDRSAVVVFTNGANGMSIVPGLIARLSPGDHPLLRWLRYWR